MGIIQSATTEASMANEQIKLNESEYSAKDVSELAGLSYRQLNSRDSKGVIPSQRETTSGWRKFSPRDVFVIMVCSEIHKQFGIPLESLGYINRMMLQPKANHLLAAAEMMDYEMTPCLLTNLKDGFIIQSSEEIGQHIRQTLNKNSKNEAAHILLTLSPIVKRLMSYLEKSTHSRKENP